MAVLDSQLAVQDESVAKLFEGMQLLETRISEAKSRKDQMVARARTARTTTKVNDMLSGVTGKTSADAFTRMEEKVEAMEAAAEVSEDMAGMEAGTGTGVPSLEGRFKELEQGNQVEDELKKMKGLLGGSSPDDESKKIEGGVDDELERLKKEAGL